MGMQNIRKVSVDAQHACEAGTGLVIQPESEYDGSLGFMTEDVVREALHFNPYPCMIACGLRKGGFRVCASFDSGLVEERHMERILGQLEKACRELLKNLQGSVGQVSCLPEEELDTIWEWNELSPLLVDESTKKLRADTSLRTGSMYPRAVVPWVVDPRNPAILCPIGCAGELWLESPLLFGEHAESPAWLVSGSSAHPGRRGTLQSTGDMVQTKEDGTLIYIGRKEDVVPEEGHGADIAALEAQFAKHVAPTARYAVALVQSPSDSANQDQEQELAIFIEAPTSDEEYVELLSSKQEITWTTSGGTGSTTTLCTSIPVTLAAALKKFDKHAHHSLASHMVPSVYIVVDKLPAKDGDVDHTLLNQLAAQISRPILDQIRDGFKEVCKQNLLQANLTPAETILRSAWAKILNVKPEQIDVDDNFFRLGGDSVLAMKLVSSLRVQGHGLTVADVFQHMRLGDAAKVLKVDVAASKAKVDPIQPFSTLSLASPPDVETFLSEVIRPQLADPSWSIQDVLPVTDSQALDVRATVDAPRTSIQYTMLYFNQRTIYRKNLLRACNELVKAHEILRTVFTQHGSSYLQVVLSDLVATVTTLSTDQPLEEYVTDLCEKEIERKHPLGSPFTSIFHISGPGGTEALVLGLSHAQYDGVSLPRLLRDLETLYTGGQVTIYAPFSTYISHTRKSEIQSQAVGYWSSLLKNSTFSILPEPSLRPANGVREKAVFLTKSVKISKGLEHITKATLVTTAWALVLSSRLHTTDLVFGSITSGRQLPTLSDADSIVGPCYQFTPVRVRLPSSLSRSGHGELMASIQHQIAASSAHDHLGFSAISRAVGWEVAEGEDMFDSVVHHQDHDDFDTMPFAGGECRVDIANPHGDAAWPLKVVSYVKKVDGREELVVGIVGAEKAKTVVSGLLEELVGAVERLTCE
jgi:aryl carrier-like protein